jgi:SEC-C motif-containing protein
MALHANEKIGWNDACPCGSGKKYKRCCLEKRDASCGLWARQRNASDELTREMMRFAARKFGDQIGEAWQDFHATDLPLPFDERSHEGQIFMPYFLFHWNPQRRRNGKGAVTKGGIIARWFTLERAGKLSDMECLFLPFSVAAHRWKRCAIPRGEKSLSRCSWIGNGGPTRAGINREYGPDFNAVRKLLKLMPTMSSDVPS